MDLNSFFCNAKLIGCLFVESSLDYKVEDFFLPRGKPGKAFRDGLFYPLFIGIGIVLIDSLTQCIENARLRPPVLQGSLQRRA